MAEDMIAKMIERLERAHDGNRSLDEVLWVWDIGDDNVNLYEAPPYTHSVDTALSLIERKMEGVSPLVGVDRNFGFDNDIPGSEETPRWNAWCYGESGEHPRSAAIALLLAMFRALSKRAQGVSVSQEQVREKD